MPDADKYCSAFRKTYPSGTRVEIVTLASGQVLVEVKIPKQLDRESQVCKSLLNCSSRELAKT